MIIFTNGIFAEYLNCLEECTDSVCGLTGEEMFK